MLPHQLEAIEAREDHHRALGIKGYGAFENIGGDLALIKTGFELTEGDTLEDVKKLCVKIYRSTNMRYQTIAKLIMRNRGEELRKMVQMSYIHNMPQHMSLVINKLHV